MFSFPSMTKMMVLIVGSGYLKRSKTKRSSNATKKSASRRRGTQPESQQGQNQNSGVNTATPQIRGVLIRPGRVRTPKGRVRFAPTPQYPEEPEFEPEQVAAQRVLPSWTIRQVENLPIRDANAPGNEDPETQAATEATTPQTTTVETMTPETTTSETTTPEMRTPDTATTETTTPETTTAETTPETASRSATQHPQPTREDKKNQVIVESWEDRDGTEQQDANDPRFFLKNPLDLIPDKPLDLTKQPYEFPARARTSLLTAGLSAMGDEEWCGGDYAQRSLLRVQNTESRQQKQKLRLMRRIGRKTAIPTFMEPGTEQWGFEEGAMVSRGGFSETPEVRTWVVRDERFLPPGPQSGGMEEEREKN